MYQTLVMVRKTASLGKPPKAILTMVLILLSGVACASSMSSDGATRKTQSPPAIETPQSSPAIENASICERIAEIKTLPFKDEAVDDDAFNAILNAGDKAIPCLIRKITDTTVMTDPRQAPKVAGTRVGDVAFFILVDLAKIDFLELVSADLRKAYEKDGVYGYFERIDEGNNRQKLQEAATKWYEKKYGRPLPK